MAKRRCSEEDWDRDGDKDWVLEDKLHELGSNESKDFVKGFESGFLFCNQKNQLAEEKIFNSGYNKAAVEDQNKHLIYLNDYKNSVYDVNTVLKNIKDEDSVKFLEALLTVFAPSDAFVIWMNNKPSHNTSFINLLKSRPCVWYNGNDYILGNIYHCQSLSPVAQQFFRILISRVVFLNKSFGEDFSHTKACFFKKVSPDQAAELFTKFERSIFMKEVLEYFRKKELNPETHIGDILQFINLRQKKRKNRTVL